MILTTCRLILLIVVAASACLLPAAEKTVIQPKEFRTGLPFSTALLVGDTLYISGQVGADLKTGKIPEDFEAEVRQCLDNIGVVLKEAKMDFSNAVSVQVYLTDMDLFPRMNSVYTTYFKEPRPTRTTVGVAKLVGTARLEVTVTARR
jgi:reactive intermediate/imine deaminase